MTRSIQTVTDWIGNHKICVNKLGRSVLLPSATAVAESNVFTTVCDSVHRGRGVYTSPPGRYPLRQTLRPRPPRRPLQRMVRILLECILVYKFRNYCQLERILNSYRFTSANADYFHWIKLGFDASFNRFLNLSIFPNLDKKFFVFGKVMQCVCVCGGG